MSNQLQLTIFRDHILNSISTRTFVKASLGNYQGNVKELKNVYVRQVVIKRNDMLSFTYRYKTRDIVKNFQIAEGVDLMVALMSNDFRICTVFSFAQEFILELNKQGVLSVRERKSDPKPIVDLLHDKEKKRIINATGKSYLTDLRISDSTGKVYKNAQDKYRQINQYIEIINSLIKGLPEGSIKQVADMGSGKGYLTFALYDYLRNVVQLEAKVTGIEYRQDLVDLCSDIATRSSFNDLKFVQGTIENYELESIDLLIALHACDTATDDAIIKGIQAGAKLIVVAPCCHKQIRREMEKNKVKNDVSFMTKHGIFLERQAEMITDGIRSLILEYFGYKTKVFEFISDVHTPKNVLIVGTKSGISDQRKSDILIEILKIKQYFGIGTHHLEKIMPC